MITMRAKFTVENIRRNASGDEIRMLPVTNGTPEDNTFSKYTPSGELKMLVSNPELLGQIHPGDVFYLDFTPAE